MMNKYLIGVGVVDTCRLSRLVNMSAMLGQLVNQIPEACRVHCSDKFHIFLVEKLSPLAICVVRIECKNGRDGIFRFHEIINHRCPLLDHGIDWHCVASAWV